MNDDRFTEDSYEQALIELFKQMGYEYEYGPNIERDYREPVNKEELRKLHAAFPSTNKVFIWRALNFKHKSVLASRIRCYTMNFLQSAEYLSTNH